MLYTIFETKQLDPNHVITEKYYMQGSINKYKQIDFNTDYRFCEIKNKRTKAIIIGEIEIKN